MRPFVTPVASYNDDKLFLKSIPGTVTAAVSQGLQYAIRNKQTQWHQAKVSNLSQSTANEACSLHLSSGTSIEVDRILLATGFGKRPPSLMQKPRLPVSNFCGYPIVDRDLRWEIPTYLCRAPLQSLSWDRRRKILRVRDWQLSELCKPQGQDKPPDKLNYAITSI